MMHRGLKFEEFVGQNSLIMQSNPLATVVHVAGSGYFLYVAKLNVFFFLFLVPFVRISSRVHENTARCSARIFFDLLPFLHAN